MFSGNSAACLDIRVWKLGKHALNEIKYLKIYRIPLNLISYSQLPDTCVSFLSAVPLLAFYRNILAETLYSPHLEGKIHSLIEPSLSLVPFISDSNELLQLASQIWDKKCKLAKRSEKVILTGITSSS